jgi:hypothetical protein
VEWAVWFGAVVAVAMIIGLHLTRDGRPLHDEHGRTVDADGNPVSTRDRNVRTISRVLLGGDNVPLSSYLIRSRVGMDRETFYDVTTYMATAGLLEALVLDRDVAYRAFRLTGRGIAAARRRVTRGRTPR